ncbi:MAG: hypothetical protein ACREPE_16535, partial [Lysobacter sp.]
MLFLLLLLLKLFPPPQLQPMPLNPEGGAQEVRRFPTEPWMASRKIRVELHLPTGAPSGKGLSL